MNTSLLILSLWGVLFLMLDSIGESSNFSEILARVILIFYSVDTCDGF